MLILTNHVNPVKLTLSDEVSFESRVNSIFEEEGRPISTGVSALIVVRLQSFAM